MRLRFIGGFHRLRFLATSLPLVPILVMVIIILFIPLGNATASRLNPAIYVSTLPPIPSPSIIVLPTIPSLGTPSSQDSQAQQILSEGQNDISIANLIIYYSGIILAILTLLIASAGIFGAREFIRRIRRLRTETEMSIQQLTRSTEEHIQQLTTIERNFREQLEQHIEHAEQESQKLEEHLEQFSKLFESESLSLRDKLEHLTQQFQEQLSQLKKDFENDSENFMEVSYHFNLGTNAYKIGDNDHAIEHYLNALQLQPNNVRVMERLGRAYSNLNDMKQAIYHLEKALSINPSNVAAWRSLALCYRYTEPEKAIEYLERSLTENPKGYEALDFLGLIYRDNGNINKAVSCHEEALEIKKRPETYFYLSILYALRGDIKGAKVMAISGDYDTSKQEHDQRIRPVWKLLIQSGVFIFDGNKSEALQLIETLKQYITTQRIYKALEGHLEFLLKATDHLDWLPEVMNTIKRQET